MLAPSEERFVRHGTYTGRSVTVAGDLDIDALSAAFGAVQRTYPVVTCRIAEDSAGRGYLLGPVAPAGMSVRNGDSGAVPLPGEPIDPRRQLAYLDVVCSGAGRARVTLFAHHSIADAGHCVRLLGQLWHHYTDYLEFGSTTVVPHGYPQPLEWHAGARGITRGPVSGFEDVIRPLPSGQRELPADKGCPALVRPQRIVLDRAATARIVAVHRGCDVTVNGLVTAVLLKAFAAEKYGAAVESVGCLYPVDMRSRFDPRIPAPAGTNMAGLACFAAAIDPAIGIIELARQISDRLRRELAAGVVQQSVLHFPEFFGPSRIHSLAGHVAVTNTGIVPAFRTPAAIELVDYEIVYLSAHPRPTAGASAAATFLVYTFIGRLTIGLLGAAAERLLPFVRAELAALSESIDA